MNPLLNFQKSGGLGRISVLWECQQIIFVTLSGILATTRERQRERERQKETERQRETHTQRETERDRDRGTERERERDRQRQTETEREGESCSVPMKNNLKSEIFNDKKS